MENIYAKEEKTPDIICASFAHRHLLDDAVHELTNQGFIAKNLFLFKAAKDHETNKSYLLDHVLIHATMTAEGALLGVVIGAIAGALLTWVGLVGPFGSASTMVMLVVNMITCAFVRSIIEAHQGKEIIPTIGIKKAS